MKDTIGFIETKLNSDVDIALMPKGDSPVDPSDQTSGILNLIDQLGNYGVKVIPKGTNLISLGYTSSQTKILAGCFDRENNAIILLTYGSFSAHRITRYYNDGTVETIYDNSGISLGFTSNEVIRNVRIIGSGTNAQLCWTSTTNPPRCLNISRGVNNQYGSSEDWISLALDAPTLPPTLSYSNDSTININNLYNKVYQFAIKYIYFDGKESSWSPYTQTIADVQEESITGVYFNRINVRNRITITYSNIPDGVEYVYIAYRYADTELNAPSSWYVYDKVAVSGNSITYYFYDNKTKYNADSTDILYLGYSVPEKAIDLEILKNNRLALINPTLYKDNVTLNISLETAYANNSGYLFLQSETPVTVTSSTPQNINLVAASESPMTVVLSLIDDQNTTSYIVYVNVGYLTRDYAYYVVEALKGIYYFTVTRNSTNVVNMQVTGSDMDVYQDSMNYAKKYKSIKSGVTHYFGIQYTDRKGRSWRVNVNSDCFLSVPYWPELNLPTSTDTYSLGIIYEITHLPPSGAVTWQWVYGGNNIAGFYQIPLICLSADTGVTKDITFTDGFIYLNVEEADNRILAKNDNYRSLITFDAKKGDRVRFKSKISRTDYRNSNSKMSDEWTLFTNFIEVPILDVDTNGIIKISSDIGYDELDDIIGNGSFNVILIEVISLSKEIDQSNLVYTEIGNAMDCSSGYHETDTPSRGIGGSWYYENDQSVFSGRNQTGSQSGLGIIDFYDVYNFFMDAYVMKNSSDHTEITFMVPFIEHTDNSLSYNSAISYGKPNYVDVNAAQRQINNVVWGGIYNESELEINELNKFIEGDSVPLDDKHGDAVASELVGQRLKVFQRSKVTGIGVEIDEIENADGSISIVNIDTVLGTPRPLSDEYGTIFPKSVVKKDAYIYFYDIYAGKVIRNAPNGNEDISRYGMANFWKIRSKSLLNTNTAFLTVNAIYDSILEMYIITVVNTYPSTSNSFTVGFHEPTNTWKTFFSFLPVGYITMGNGRLFGFRSGNISGNLLYEHHVNETRNNFYGTQYSSYITFVCNIDNIFKKFLTIATDSNAVWEAYDNDSIITGEDSIDFEDADSYVVHTKKQQSRLREIEDVWRFVRNVFKAAFRRNMITNQPTADVYDLVTGDPLRGKYMKIKLSNDNTVETNLKSVEIEYEPLGER